MTEYFTTSTYGHAGDKYEVCVDVDDDEGGNLDDNDDEAGVDLDDDDDIMIIITISVYR